MKNHSRNKAFTLIELLIVLMVVGILAAIIFINYTGAQRKARDNKRKADLQTIATAYLMHYQETKRWYFNDSELQKIDPSVPSGRKEGAMGSGIGYFNLPNGTGYVAMSRALNELGYISNTLRDPLISSDDISKTTEAIQYMKYDCWIEGKVVGIFLFARLEDPSSVFESNTTLDKCAISNGAAEGSLKSTMSNSTYKLNYALEVR